MTANKFDINILHNNFDILRASKKLSKKEFCDLIGIANAYRRDFSSIGPKLLRGITDHFKGIDENWLLSKHDVDYKFNATLNTPVNESPAAYRETPPSTKDPSNNYLTMTAAIIGTPSIFATALKSNIEAFHSGIRLQQELAAARAMLTIHDEQLKSQRERMNTLEDLIRQKEDKKAG